MSAYTGICRHCRHRYNDGPKRGLGFCAAFAERSDPVLDCPQFTAGPARNAPYLPKDIKGTSGVVAGA